MLLDLSDRLHVDERALLVSPLRPSPTFSCDGGLQLVGELS